MFVTRFGPNAPAAIGRTLVSGIRSAIIAQPFGCLLCDLARAHGVASTVATTSSVIGQLNINFRDGREVRDLEHSVSPVMMSVAESSKNLLSPCCTRLWLNNSKYKVLKRKCPENLIDIHSHVLWGVDDGAESLAESLEMIRTAAEAGTSDIVATPHASPVHAFETAIIQSKIAKLSEISGGAVRIHFGCDFHLSFENLQDALSSPNKYTINQGAYLLVELPNFVPVKVEPALSALRQSGIICIITHPERCASVQRDPGRVKMWVDQGCLVQLTAQSLLGEFGKSAKQISLQLIREDLVHFIASDAHSTKRRPPRLDLAYEAIVLEWGKERADQLCRLNPEAVIRNQQLPYPARARRKWYRLWQ